MPGRLRAATLRQGRYLQREPAGEPGHLTAYGPETDTADIDALAERCADDRHQFRFIVSPEDGVALDHRDTDNPHTHVLLRGKAADGQDLVIDLRQTPVTSSLRAVRFHARDEPPYVQTRCPAQIRPWRRPPTRETAVTTTATAQPAAAARRTGWLISSVCRTMPSAAQANTAVYTASPVRTPAAA